MIPPSSSGSVEVSVNDRAVTVIESFDVTAADLTANLPRTVEHVNDHWRDQPGFAGWSVMGGRRGGVLSYTRWEGHDDSALAGVVPQAWSLSGVMAPAPTVHSGLYTVEFTRSTTSTSRLSLAETPLAHTGTFTVARGDQDRLLDLAREHAPRSLGTPGLSAISFHRGLDGVSVLNLGLWSSFDGIEGLLAQRGFGEGDQYWSAVAEFRPDFFDVLAVSGRPA